MELVLACSGPKRGEAGALVRSVLVIGWNVVVLGLYQALGSLITLLLKPPSTQPRFFLPS